MKKERFISRRGPDRGGVVITRLITWPGGDLYVNADATEGALRVRVSSEKRVPVEGFNYEESDTFTADELRARIRWKDRSLDELTGQNIRLEIYLEKADLFAFVAGGTTTTSIKPIKESQDVTE